MPDDIQQFSVSLLQNLSVDALVSGNVTKEVSVVHGPFRLGSDG